MDSLGRRAKARAAGEGGVLPRDGRPVIATVGTFDGVHLGHRAVVQEIVGRAHSRGGRSVLVTFDPHPLRVVAPARAPKLLTTPGEKKRLLAETGLDYAVFLAFTPALKEFSPRRFVREVLLDALGMTELVIGHDHGFGKGRAGNADVLREIAGQEGFALEVTPPVRAGEDTVSSSFVRQALATGRLADANRALGRPYSLTGAVVRGHGRGRELGFPTANLRVSDPDKLVPAPGVYACWTEVAGRRLMGALHVGPRPVFPTAGESVEVHLLDFDGDVYGRRAEVALVALLRPVRDYRSPKELAAQIAEDVRRTRQLLGCPSPGPRSGPPTRGSA